MKKRQKIKYSPIIRQTIILLMFCLTANCYSGPGGDLYPQGGEGYTIVETSDDRKVAQVVHGEIIIQIDGSWSESRFNNSFKIENNSTVPFSLDFAQVKMEIYREEAVKTRIWFITDYSNYDTSAFDDAKNAKKVYEYRGNDLNGKPLSVGSTKVSCLPKQKCIFSVNVTFSETKLNKDKSVKTSLPALSNEGKETEVLFNLRRNSIWDSLTARIN